MSIPKKANIELIKATFGMLKKMGGDPSSIQEEASMLGISFEDNDITLAQYLVVNSDSIKDAISKAEEISFDEINLIFNKINLEEQEKIIAKEKKAKARAEKLAEEKAEEDLAEQKQSDAFSAGLVSHPLRYINDYQIVSATHHYELQKKVKEEMKSGWKPLGSMSFFVEPKQISLTATKDKYYQTMVQLRKK